MADKAGQRKGAIRCGCDRRVRQMHPHGPPATGPAASTTTPLSLSIRIRRSLVYHTIAYGSAASRRPSPRKLKPSTARIMKITGDILHGVSPKVRRVCALHISRPQLTIGNTIDSSRRCALPRSSTFAKSRTSVSNANLCLRTAKIRKIHGAAAIGNGEIGKRTEYTPFDGIIYVNVRR